ncbi:cytochrome c biogenesis CcdA family protein [Flaviflexus huanghaiensis]|uniref:cytochrome c biogenesis CcdA family protein n=1 Tax=Flaviflexus huanghaiensis TaxID=1111473 RepID=UPI0015FDBABD|nr:cytochrome c biogenesis CcdA family protein [Flaviflexus huanghaiensis]
MDVGFVTAFLGGVLALLSPCAALLLPSFFASTVNSGTKLLLHTGVFYGGLLVILVPLGVGAGAFGSLFLTHRTELITVSSLLLIVLGIAQIFGFGFDPSKVIPGQSVARGYSASATGLAKTFLLGTTSGVAGFCAGPILGAVLTVAAASGDGVTAGLLLAVYGAGMVVPLLIIVALWRPLGGRGRSLLRGRGFTIGRLRFHTTSVLAGLLIIATGILFWTTNGLVGMPEIISADTQVRLQEGAGILANPIVDIAAILAVAVLITAIWFARRTKNPDGPSDPKFAGSHVNVAGENQPIRNIITPRETSS